MTKIVNQSQLKAPSKTQVKSTKAKLGKMLKRLRAQTVRDDGRKLSVRDISEATGISASGISSAERGTVTIDNYIKLVGYYRGLNSFGIVDILESADVVFVPEPVLKKFANEEELLTREFLRAVTLFPEQAYKVTYAASKELLSLGFAVKSVEVDYSMQFYACDVKQAKREDGEWEVPSVLLANPLASIDNKSESIMQWATDVLRQAMSEHPEYSKLLNEE